jgi:hypothetical protein
VILVDHGDSEAAQLFIASWLMGALCGCPVDLKVEPHQIGDRLLPSFEVRMAATTMVVHVDLSIDDR